MKLQLKDFYSENDEVYYHITIEMKSLEWNVKKRFSHFYILYNELHQLYPDFPIPKLEKQINFGKLMLNQQKRKEQLNKFLKYLSNILQFLLVIVI